jgi:hypothetical protein
MSFFSCPCRWVGERSEIITYEERLGEKEVTELEIDNYFNEWLIIIIIIIMEHNYCFE